MVVGAAAPSVSIDGVRQLAVDSSSVKYRVDRPEPGDALDRLELEVRGWLISRDVPVEKVEVLCRDELVREAAIGLPRPAVAKRHPDEPMAAQSGFQTSIGAFRLPPRFCLTIRTILENGQALDLAEITGSRRSLSPAGADAGLRPLFISSPTGRSGTTWSVQMMRQHPGIVGYPPFGVEPRLATYWLEAAGSLAEPSSYMRCMRPKMDRPHWWLGDWPSATLGSLQNDEVAQLLGEDTVEYLADLIRERVETFYRLVAAQQDKEPEYFVEKGPLGRMRLDALSDLFPGLRQLVIFRDPRDTVCSIISYRERRPGAALVRKDDLMGDGGVEDELLESIAANIRGMLAQSAELDERVVTIRYEDLITNPADTLEPVLEQLDLDRSEGSRRAMVEAAAADFPRMERHLTSPSAEESIGRWRLDMSEEVQERAQVIFADVLEALGYD